MFFLVLLIVVSHLAAQDTLQLPYFNIGGIRLVEPLRKDIGLAYLDHGQTIADADINRLNFNRGAIHRGFIPDQYVTRKALMRFNICNLSDTTTSIWYHPGFYYSEIKIFRLRNGSPERIPDILPPNSTETSYRLITLEPGDSAKMVVELTFLRTYLNRVYPRLIAEHYVTAYSNEIYATNNAVKIFTYLFCGLLLMMILFSLANYVQGGSAEFLFYSGYAFFVGLMLLLKAIYTWRTSRINFFQESYLDYVLLCIGHLFYMLFMRRYLNTKTDHPFLHRLYLVGVSILVISVTFFSYAHYFTDSFALEKSIENLTKILLLAMVVIVLVYSVRHWEDRLLRFVFWGNLCLFVFSLISQLIIMGNAVSSKLPEVLQSSLSYYEMGLLLELIFFLAGLNYKNRKELIAHAAERERLRAENQMNEYEKEIAVYKAQQRERERISADMHDELGSGMTAIRLMSEIARNKMKENTPVEIEKISYSANEVLNKMNAIIWSMNSGNDTVDNLVSYIRAYALEYFEYTEIDCKIFTPEHIESLEMAGEKRRNLFLCVKETLNNVLKHSKAKEVRISFTIDDALTIRIEDNGVGIDKQKIRQFGNGLKNIAKRMQSIGGTYSIENNGGTVSVLRLPL